MNKIKVDEFNRVCRLANLIQILNSVTYPTWKNKMNTEGLELKGDKILTFHFKDGQRLYNQPIDDKNILAVVGAFEEKPEVVKEEKVLSKDLEKIDPSKDLQGLIPDYFTKALIEKWQKMTTVERMLMVQRTPKDQIFQKPVGKKDGVEQFASYVKGNYMIREANFVFLFDWHFDQKGISIGDKGVSVYGDIYANVDGKVLSRPAVGYEEINQKMTPQLAIKSATTDAIKKGLSLFGFNSDVYSGDL